MTFDTIVIGSSPKLILEAIKLCNIGNRVCLIDRDVELGGCWSILNDETGNSCENACHLIEWFNGCYERLEALTGHPFELLEPTPKRFFKNGYITAYTSKIGIIKSFFTDTYSLCILGGRVLIPGRFSRDDRLSFFNAFLKSYKVYFKYRVNWWWRFSGLMGPVGGYASLQRSLTNLVNASNLKLIRGEVDTITCFEKSVKVSGDFGKIAARKTVIGDSADLYIRTVSGEKLKFNSSEKNDNFHVLISLHKGLLKQKISYIHFPDDDVLNRITNAGQCPMISENVRLFIQFRHVVKQFDLDPLIRKCLGAYRLTRKDLKFDIVLLIRRSYYQEPHKQGSIDLMRNNIVYINTYGDLAKSLLISP